MKTAKSTEDYQSIRSRLILHYSFVVFIILLIVSLLTYWMVIALYNHADYAFLEDEISSIHYVSGMDHLEDKLLHEITIEKPLQSHNSWYRYYVRIYNQHGVIIETPQASTIIPIEHTRYKLTQRTQAIQYFRYSYQNKNYLLAESSIKLAGRLATVQIILDTSYQQAWMADKRIMLLAFSVGLLIALLAGIFITQRGLNSLHLLTETVRTITSQSLDQRIDAQSWPKELQALGEAFNQMLDRIEASFSRLKQMSADMSHELRTPITNLIMQTELLLSYSHTENEYQTAIAANLDELRKISSIIDNILFLARASHPTIKLNKQRVDVKKEIQSVLDYYQILAEEKNIQFCIKGDAQLSVEPIMFRRLINNIISNAVKYTECGQITITIYESKVNIIVISIQDPGIGIEEKHIPYLFDRFYRIEEGSFLQARGTGLGLAIAKSIVLLHGGTIKIHSQLGQGTCVELYLPIDH